MHALKLFLADWGGCIRCLVVAESCMMTDDKALLVNAEKMTSQSAGFKSVVQVLRVKNIIYCFTIYIINGRNTPGATLYVFFFFCISRNTIITKTIQFHMIMKFNNVRSLLGEVCLFGNYII